MARVPPPPRRAARAAQALRAARREVHLRRGHPNEATPAAPINRDPHLRRSIYLEALDVIAGDPALHVHTVEHVGRQDRRHTYRGLLDALQAWLVDHDDHGVVVMDGTDQLYPTIHRELDLRSRRIVEDAWLQDSRTSQFVQVADLVVHAAFQAAARRPARSFMWDWYPERFPPVRRLE